MSLKVVLPPDEPPGPDGTKPGGWWHQSPDGRKLVCDLCPRACVLGPGDRGFCFVRQNRGGRIVSTTYGRSTGFCIDPIEKKPLNHFYPGTAILSFGTAGCNLGCKFCQNWSMTKSRQVDLASEAAMPDQIAQTAQQLHCESVAFTYNDPIVWAEYAIDTARACRRLGIKTVAVTSGYMTPAAREAFYEFMDAANVDLKGFTEQFYWKLTSGHLEPVLDTLRWLVRQTKVWVEITNLLIPQANDSPEEIRRLCQWVAGELGPDVPLHFTAFHPDFRLTDRGPTPPSTLRMAYEIAQQAGLRHVYTGNISDRRHQSTYCPGCGRVVIERDGYHLGVYALDQNRCRYCGAEIAGRFGQGPGTWGPRRMPVRIAHSSNPPNPSRHPTQGEKAMKNDNPRPGHGAGASGSGGHAASPQAPGGEPSSAPADVIVPERPQLTKEQQERVFRAAARRVAAAVRAQPAQQLDEVLAEVADLPVFGSFVSLKRSGQLRSCCGFLGPSVSLAKALDHAAVRAAKDDPRFPPISPLELEYLDMEVWILWGMKRVPEQGEDRIKAVTIGKHGLQIARGHARGLLLPSVAVEHGLDAEGFLRQVCLKAGLPPTAWKESDTDLMTFEGYAIRGRFDPALLAESPEPSQTGPTSADVSMLADFCRDNLIAVLYGATPAYYAPGGYDANVHGAVLSVRLPGRSEAIDCARVSLRPEIPLQAGLMDLVKAAASTVRSVSLRAESLEQISVGLTVLWDPAMLGTVADYRIEGIDTRRRAIMVTDQSKWVVAYDPQSSASELAEEAIRRARLSGSSRAGIYSMAVVSTEARVVSGNVPAPQDPVEVRPPAVAGRFYPGTPADIDRMLEPWIPADRKPERWAGVMVPHAGWVYSGRLAAAALSRVEFPSQVIIVCPKHRPDGADWAVAPYRAWSIPGGQVASDPELARRLAEAVTDLALDADAHRGEHAIEVQLPIVARLAPNSRVVGIAIHAGDLPRLQKAGQQLAGALRDLPDRPLLVISTDMNHYAEDSYTRRVDRMALDAIESLDPARLYQTVLDNRISMCGMIPAVLVLETLRQLGCLNQVQAVGYATSAETSGDRTQVVGYAAMLFR
ncbi:MAG: AmmeMemoRadiSam system radical SAM enzyme [Thermoguttaceae bacterium]